MATQFPVENLLLDRRGNETLHRQLYLQLRSLIERRRLPSGAMLPATRQFAKDLQVGRNTVIAAYEQLALEGFVSIAHGRRPVISELPIHHRRETGGRASANNLLSRRGQLMARLPYHHGEPGMLAFHPGLPDAQNFPFNTWARLVARRAKHARNDLFGTYHVTGYPLLKEALAHYLAASRGVDCEPGQIIITPGAQSAFDILARILTDPGDKVWMEEPGYYGAAAAFLSAGAELMPFRVSKAGWDLSPPPHSPKLIFVTPSCHYPLGHTMNMEQRLNLVRLADSWGSWIIEDDYDSEYRFQGQPIPALQGVAKRDKVIFIGTFAKILFPAMRLGYMVVPKLLLPAVNSALSATGQFAPLMVQAALADFMNEGYLIRHLRQMRRLYASRRSHFIAQFNQHVGHRMILEPTDSGIQIAGYFKGTVNDRKIAAAIAAAGLNVSPLSMQFRFKPVQQGLLMGFAAADGDTATQSLLDLATILDAHI